MKSSTVIPAAVFAISSLFSGHMAEASTVPDPKALPSLAGNYRYAWTKEDDVRFGNTSPLMLALNETAAAGAGAPQSNSATLNFEPPLFTSSNAHKFLGLGTVLFAGLTALAAPEEGCEHNCPPNPPPRQTSGTTHTRLARTTAVLAVATLTSGLLAHWDDFYVEDGITDPDNQHVMLGTTGALMMLYAIHKSANSSTQTSHAGIAELGGVAMAVAIKLTW
jgi:hypothetical protein